VADFAAAHTLRNYPGAGSRLHGHNWKIQAHIVGEQLDESGMLIDFGDVKKAVKEILFLLDHKNLNRIIEVAPEIVSHNLETVRRLTREVRIQAKYDRSLGVLKYLKDQGLPRTKSGIMLGLGETKEEVIQTMQDLADVNVDIITIGQYLQPSKKHLPVKEFITPEQFKKYEEIGKKMGFRHVESGALVRSSYKAQKHLL